MPDAAQPGAGGVDGTGRSARRATRGPRANHEQRLAAEMRKRIYDGEWPDGMQLPSQSEMEGPPKSGRSVQTVRLAVIALENEGLVSKGQGRLTTVTFREPTHPLAIGPVTGDRVAEPSLSFGGDASRGERRTHAQRRTVVPLRLASLVGLQSGATVVERTTAVTVDDELIALSISYLPPALTSRDDGTAWHTAGIGQLAVVGHPLAAEPLVARSRMPDPDERALLGVGKGVPMWILSRACTVGEDAIAAGVVVLARADRVLLTWDPDA